MRTEKHDVRRRRLRAVVAALLVAASVAGAQEAGTERTAWHLPKWDYRQTVELVTRDPSGGINTGLIELEAGTPIVAADGRDLRVLDANGRPVKFQLVDGQGQPLKGKLEPDRAPRVQFEVSDLAMHRYSVYFGNPEATSAQATWEKRIGELTLETRGHPTRQPAKNLKEMKALLAGGKWRYGQGPRRNINDSENSFGPQEAYLSIYKGLIYCPTDGTYRFGTDSDDSSFLLIGVEPEDRLVVQWGDSHSPKGSFEHFGDINLEAGVHAIRYYHVQAGGGSLARAGWRPPGAHEIVTIPPEAFVRELRTRTLAVEKRDTPLSAFFTVEFRDTIRFGSSGPTFAKVVFKDKSRSAVSEISVREWDFGDGTVSREAEPEHIFVSGRPCQVTLRCVDKLGYEAIWLRNISVATQDAERVDVAMEVSAPNLLPPGEPLRVTVRCKSSGLRTIEMAFVSEERSFEGALVDSESRPVSLRPDVWESWGAASGRGGAAALETGELAFSLKYMGVPVIVRRVAVRSAVDPAVDLSLVRDHLADEAGVLQTLRLSSGLYKAKGRPVRDKLSRGGTVRVVIVDGSLAGSGDKSYVDHLTARLKKRFPNTVVEIVPVNPEDMGTTSNATLPAVVHVPRAAKDARPDLVIVAGSLRDVVRFTPVKVFERMLHVLVDRLEAVTGAEVLLVAPPPMIANPGLGQAYAISVKRVGLRRGVAVADVYSAFMSAGRRADADSEQGWRTFYRDPDSPVPLYHLAPTTAGQVIIADTLVDALLSRRSRPRRERDDPRE